MNKKIDRLYLLQLRLRAVRMTFQLWRSALRCGVCSTYRLCLGTIASREYVKILTDITHFKAVMKGASK